ncbi:GNAT family N-acetyltransferase [Vibrio sp. THAF190c]|uniref:GNAT family N-acetyltransferase n=1 Tax=Vibrio sp. THAF190c TaxID=2587865 RepID=UPI0012678681|nr:GNAT family N-acetyltransferase [Vibrio sp. THAF190c]QFT12467.1 Acetyltransferase (GNAT) family protein [Vibrio sp. THAF190c]
MIERLPSTDPSLIAFSKTVFAELRSIYRPTMLAQQNKMASTGDWTYFGYYLEQRLVAVVSVKLSGDTLHLSALAVSSTSRRKGVARHLISEVQQMFPHANQISVWCVEQTGNVNVFESLGFKVVERIESDDFELTNTSGEKAIEVRLERKLVK